MKINSRIGWQEIFGEIAVFNCLDQNIFIFNNTASDIWKMVNEGKDIDYIIQNLTQKYQVSNKQIKIDVISFLKQLSEQNLINSDIIKNKNLTLPRLNDDNGENVLLYLEMRAIENLIPFAVTFETTYDCNENCVHCYMDKNLLSLRLDEIKNILNEIAKEGCLFLTFTGGEFFMRNDALEILKYASNLHFVIDVLSNGTLINKEIVEEISNYSVRRVQVSLYGANQKIHDSITKVYGSFLKTNKAIELLKERNIKVEIAFPMMNQNFNELRDIKDLAERMQCVFSPNHITTARNNGLKDTFKLRISDKQLKEFLENEELSSSYSGRKPFKEHQFYFGFSDLLDASPCYSGFNSCAITPLGKVFPCNQFLYEIGNLRKNSFSEIWLKSPQLQYLRNLTIRNLEKCSFCKLLKNCSRCPGLAYLEGGDMLGISPENCRTSLIISNLNSKFE